MCGLCRARCVVCVDCVEQGVLCVWTVPVEQGVLCVWTVPVEQGVLCVWTV